MSHILRIALLTLALLAMLTTLRPPPASARPVSAPVAVAWSPPDPDAAQSSVIVSFDGQPALQAASGATRAERRASLLRQLHARADASQAKLRATLTQLQSQGRVASFTVLWAINAIAITADTATIQQIARVPGVARVATDASFRANLAPVLSPSLDAVTVTDNLTKIKAPDLWSLGFTGQGMVVASMDTGVQGDHPDLSAKRRPGSDASSWFDPYGQHTTPADITSSSLEFKGHGTQVMGLMVGGDVMVDSATNTVYSVGVAPDATWIAAKIFDDNGDATESAIHAAFQWLLDPDGDPNTDDAPDVVNN
ncbi:S8 family serine peptidase, partial [Oscillochloris sp. ZM17-4]|uniref:S8 family serine peptidase n=1 Tax=Oscillochloris sp. ZM17-4 TaxID=2866714 RepID=UPI001C73513D